MKEKDIEEDIFQYLEFNKIFAFKVNTKGNFNPKIGAYMKLSKYTRRGVSDIIGIIQGQFLAIEVKKPSEINFFLKSYEELEQVYCESLMKGEKGASRAKKAEHAIEQKQFIDEVIEEGGVGFFAKSLHDVQEGLKDYDLMELI